MKPVAKYHSYYSSLEEAFVKPLPGGENYNDTRIKVGEFIYDLEKKFFHKNILIVTHESPAWLMFSVAQGLDIKSCVKLSGMGESFLENSEFKELDFVPLPHNENYELDLHKPFIDQVVLVDKKGNELKRVKEVMDVWFDSGAMPFAQDHYPFENKKWVETKGYPADFISEAVDQTRGWFYTLLAIGVLMDRGTPYKNVICLGHVLDSKGKKMSKSLGNTIDPWQMMDKYGADSLRLWMYTVNQPGDSKNFDEKTVDEVIKKVFNLAENILSFYNLYRDKKIKPHDKSKHILDQWIISKTNSLVREGGNHLENFKVFEAARLIRDFVNDFSTWYIRRSRDRFKSDDIEDKNNALATTHFVLLELAKYMAPFTPFFAEHIYLKLKSEKDPESVHLCSWPHYAEASRGKPEEILNNMQEVRKIVSLALEKRMAAGIKVRQPLSKLKVKSKKLENKEEYLELIKDEVNIKEIEINNSISEDVELDTAITPELQKEGNVRDFVRTIQELRKNKNLVPSDVVELLVETDEKGKEFLNSVSEKIKKMTNVNKILFENNDGEELRVQSLKFKIQIK
jgi:isoleucyl-tRNA synthetase